MKKTSTVDFPGNNRVHIALAVKDLGRSKAFYEILLEVPPTKERSGYIKFEPQDPSLNLTLNEVSVSGDTSSPATHYGIQVKSTQAVEDIISKFSKTGLATKIENETTCCYAVQDKVWVTDPDNNLWEVFVVLDNNATQRKDATSSCCTTDAAESLNGACC